VEEEIMVPATDIADLIARARAGEEPAIRDFLTRFEGELRIMVRGRLPRKLRSQFDSMDFVQAVWKSFFSDLHKLPPNLENEHQLRGFLAGVARNKVNEVHRRLTRTKKYALARQQPLIVRRGGFDLVHEPVSPEPSPSEDVQAHDRLAQLISGCTPREVEVIQLRHHGLTFEEIATRMGLHERSVRRVIDQARTRMEARGWR
jgi:RNA polymerase sigma factor (sigma-70 family)